MKIVPHQLAPWLQDRLESLGTDGFGRSDYRVKLRQFFEVDRHYVTVAALKQCDCWRRATSDCRKRLPIVSRP